MIVKEDMQIGYFIDKFNLRDRIEATGGFKNIKDDCEYTHLVLEKNELKEIEMNNFSASDISDELGVNFVSVKRKGDICFTHVTDVKNKEAIQEEGLMVVDNTFIPDLGVGIYAIDTDNFVAIDNLKYYASENIEGETVLVVGGYFQGIYTECINTCDHEGYIVLLTGTGLEGKLLDLEEVPQVDFLID